MKIGELARQADCDVQTVRYYEREGLLEAPDREASGYRRYAARHLAQLQFIRHCRALDIPLAEVRQLLACAAEPSQACHTADALIDGHIGRVRRQLAALRGLERQLVALRRQCRGDDAAGSCAIIEAFRQAPAAQDCACHAAATT